MNKMYAYKRSKTAAALMEQKDVPTLSLAACIHILEHSQLQSRHFDEAAVTAAYVNALAAMYEKLDREQGGTNERETV